MTSVRRSVVGSGAALGTMALLGVVMLLVRSHLSTATVALVLVTPVVVGVVVGGFPAGAAAAVAGFLVYDIVFVPPYYRLSVDSSQDWVALVVYLVVVLLVARVVSIIDRSASDLRRREDETRRLLELSQLLVEDRALPELLQVIVSTVQTAFGSRSVALFLPSDGSLEMAASAGEELSAQDLRRIMPERGTPASMAARPGEREPLQAFALTVTGRPVGLLALRGEALDRTGRNHLLTFANHIAMALERAQLREQALRTELLEEVDEARKALMAAASHDLRTPLATIKMSASALLDPLIDVPAGDRKELLALIDSQADRLDRLVKNLLDMSRIQAGALRLQREELAVPDVVEDVLRSLAPAVPSERVEVLLRPDLPVVHADPVLIGEVMTNLIDNAVRYSPSGTPVSLTARSGANGCLQISVTDQGPGVPPGERDKVFEAFTRDSTRGGAGLGLSIARAFVEAHGGEVWIDDAPRGGARVSFTLPVSSLAGISS